MQQLDLRERQLERPDGLEQVRVAVLMHEHDERVEVGGQGGWWRWGGRGLRGGGLSRRGGRGAGGLGWRGARGAGGTGGRSARGTDGLGLSNLPCATYLHACKYCTQALIAQG